MARYSLEDGGYEPDWSDKLEPYASKVALGADAIGLGTALTGWGAPAGGIIALLGNVPNGLIDAYQMGRDWYRYYNDGGGDNLKGALWNTAETALDLVGGKLVSKGFKRVSEKEFADEVKGRMKDEIRKRQKQRFMLRKKGMTDEEITEYIAQKAAAATANSKDIIDAEKHIKEQNNKRARIVGHLLSGTQNGYNVIEGLPNDATRINRPNYAPLPIQLR